VIAAGGIMDGRGIAAALALGASGAQLGTAFITAAESGAPEPYRRSLAESEASSTKVTGAFTGRHARGLRSDFFDELERSSEIPPYPVQQSLTRDLTRPALEHGDLDYAIRLAGQGSPMVRSLPAGELVETLARETEAAIARLTGG
jgi:nitronate monooxygenase